VATIKFPAFQIQWSH